MKDYTFLVTNAKQSEITVRAEDIETAKNRLKDFDIIKEECCGDDYDFDNAELVKTRELPSKSKILSFQNSFNK